MADKTIASLNPAAALDGTELLPVVQTGTTLKLIVSVLSAYVAKFLALDALTLVSLTANTTIANPTGLYDGQKKLWRLKQDATGGWTVTLGTKFRIPDSATTPLAYSTVPSKMSYLAAQYNLADDKWDVISLIPGF